MRTIFTAGCVALVMSSTVALAAPAAADPSGPCGLAIDLLCRFVPVAPELDHDIDLTQPAGPDNPVPASLAPPPPPPDLTTTPQVAGPQP